MNYLTQLILAIAALFFAVALYRLSSTAQEALHTEFQFTVYEVRR